jgi:sporulation protein YlmC with PRC-barrel domain
VTEIQVGSEVLDRSGQRLGRVEGIVVDEHAHRVTHLVVAGHLVGIGRFNPAGEGSLALDLDQEGLARMPPSDLEQVSPPGSNWLAPAGRRLGDFLAIASALVGGTPYTPPVHADLGTSLEPHITQGSPVWAGRERLGQVAELLVDDRNRITGLVLRRSGVLGHEVVVPAEHVQEVVGNNVHLDLGPEQLDSLPQRA